jgi:hypothetical protein
VLLFLFLFSLNLFPSLAFEYSTSFFPLSRFSLQYSLQYLNPVASQHYGKRRGHTRNFAKVPPSLKPEQYQVLVGQTKPSTTNLNSPPGARTNIQDGPTILQVP